MAESFYTLLTNAGKAQLANAMTYGTKVTFATIQAGDGNGSYYNPSETQTSLVNTVWTGNITSVTIDPDNSNWIIIEGIIPSSVGGFTIREYGIFDNSGNLLAISKCAETYKPVITDGSTKELILKTVLVVTNTSSINLTVDPTVSLATKADVTTLQKNIENEITNLYFQTPSSGSTTTNLKLILPNTLINGNIINFIATANNNGNTTTINSIYPLYKPNTTIAPILMSGKGYTAWYNLSGNCFFIKASAEGNTIASHVLAGDTFSNNNDTGLIGNMPNNGTLGNNNFPINGTYNIPLGYTTGGQITQNIPILNATTYISTTTDQIIPLGQYLSGNQVIKGYSDLKAENIVKDKVINGITGNVTIQSLGGINYCTGTAVGSQAVNEKITITGFNFTPKFGILVSEYSPNGYHTCSTLVNGFFYVCYTNTSECENLITDNTTTLGSITFPLFSGTNMSTTSYRYHICG